MTPTAFADGVPVESAPCNATVESITITEELIANELAEVRNGLGFQPAMARAQNEIFTAVLNNQTNGYGYAELLVQASWHLIGFRPLLMSAISSVLITESLSLSSCFQALNHFSNCQVSDC